MTRWVTKYHGQNQVHGSCIDSMDTVIDSFIRDDKLRAHFECRRARAEILQKTVGMDLNLFAPDFLY